MIPRTELTGARPLSQVEAPLPVTALGDVRQQLYSRLALIGIGKTMMADVLSRLNDGTFIVKIADTAVRVAIPADARVGDQIPLKLIATEPRPVFLLTQQQAEPTTPGASTASLSSAARVIANVLSAAQQQGTPTAIVAKAPLLASPQTPPAQVAAALHDAISYSGVFYESHVQQWASGERPLAALMREPQAQPVVLRPILPGERSAAAQLPAGPLPQAVKPTGYVEASLPELARLIDIVTDLDSTVRPATATDGKTSEIPKTSDSAPDAASIGEKIDNESSQRINLQLNTLENNRIAWQGELWPGQKLEWEVSEDAPRNDADNPEQSSWTSVVRFELPMLGVVTANIHLDGDRVRMQVKTTTDQAAAALRSHSDELATALGAAGSPLDLLTVKKDEET